MASRVVSGFLPSTSGFRFPNEFPHVPVRRIGIPGVVSIPIGDASNGLCGGMVFAARDYFEAKRTPPFDPRPPASGPLFDYIVDRLFASFNLPFGPGRYLALMNPLLADGETMLSRLRIAPHGRAWVTLKIEWPKIRAELDEGHPSALGLVRVKSANPVDLKLDHQVLAYGYALEPDRLTLRLYDPNQPGRDDVTLSVSPLDPTHPVSITSTPLATPTYALFRVPYRPASPP